MVWHQWRMKKEAGTQNNSTLQCRRSSQTVRAMTDFFNAFLLVYAGRFRS